MKRRKTVAILMAAALMLCSQGVLPVSAEETENGTEIMTQTSEPESPKENGSGLETEPMEEPETQQKTETEAVDGNADQSGEVQEATAEQTEETEAADENADLSGEMQEATAEQTEETEAVEAAPLAMSEENEQTDEVEETFQAATDLHWDGIDTICFTNPNEKGAGNVVSYLYKDGQLVTSRQENIAVPYGEHSFGDMSHHIEESGSYRFRIELYPEGVEADYRDSDGYVSEMSPALDYVRPETKIGIPQDVQFSPNGTVSWNPVENADAYSIQLGSDRGHFIKEIPFPVLSTVTISAEYVQSNDKCIYDFINEMNGGTVYYVRVRALSDDVTQWAHGDWSETVSTGTASVAESVNEKLDEITQEDQTVQEQVNSVKDKFQAKEDKRELRVAIQTSEETRNKVQALEEAYMADADISVGVKANDSGIDGSAVKILGAALNATTAGTVTFNISKMNEEEEKEMITSTGYKNAVVLDLDLNGAGIETGVELAVPVRVTMPVPEGLNADRLTILHYNADGTKEKLDTYNNGDGTVSFTVTHFSPFLFAEVDSGSEGSESSGNTQNNSTDGNNAATDGNGIYMSSGDATVAYMPEWKPTTPDEIKRYNVVGREKVSYVADATNPYAVNILNVMQGKLCFDSFEAVLGDYTIGRTYSILPEGRTAYKMDSKVRITLSIPEALRASNREYKMICVTKGGLPIILDDLDDSADTITFETDTYYAFALIYKDAK